MIAILRRTAAASSLLASIACGFDSEGVATGGSASIGSGSDDDGGTTTSATTTATTAATTMTTSADAASAGDDSPPETGSTADTGPDSTSASETGCVIMVFHTDVDGDGFGDPNAPVRGCDMPAGTVPDDSDCNDNDPAIHPGVDELCNGVDDDCDDGLDEWSPMNTACNGCVTAPLDNEVLYACPGSVTWDAARMDCEVKGAEIASILSAEDNAAAFGLAGALVQADVWIGLRRDDFAAPFAWADGAAVAYTNWRLGAPDTTSVQFACVELDTLDAGLWNDVDCGDAVTTSAWLCRGPQ